MSKLTALKKQIATLQAQAERIAKTEASSAIVKIKEIMAEFNLTIEHLTATVTGKPAAKKTTAKVAPKVKAASVAKYADPKSGKTWSGFGRAPGWISGAKNREAFLVDKSGIKTAEPAVQAPVAAKKTTGKKVAVKKAAVKVARAVKVAKKVAMPAGQRMKAEATAAAKAAVKTAATKPAAVKKAATKKVTKPKAVAKKASGRKTAVTAAAPAPAEAPAAAA